MMDGFTEALGEEPKIAKKNRPGSPDSLHSRSSSGSKHSLQDRLFTKYALYCPSYSTPADAHRLLQQVIPGDNGDEGESSEKAIASPTKPAFSLPVMANNFRRFNARYGRDTHLHLPKTNFTVELEWYSYSRIVLSDSLPGTLHLILYRFFLSTLSFA